MIGLGHWGGVASGELSINIYLSTLKFGIFKVSPFWWSYRFLNGRFGFPRGLKTKIVNPDKAMN